MLPNIDVTPFRVGTIVDVSRDDRIALMGDQYVVGVAVINSYEISESGLLRVENRKIVTSSLEQHVSLEMRRFGNKLETEPAWIVGNYQEYFNIGKQIFFVEYTRSEYDTFHLKLMRALWKEEENWIETPKLSTE